MKDISAHNLAVYDTAFASFRYKRFSDLFPAESRILTNLKPRLEGKRILDIGVGGGRTTAKLFEISQNYVGIDFAPAMIMKCKARHPAVNFEVCDARDLSRFGDGAFDLVLFSFNGINSMSHADRLLTLQGIRRVLSKSGVFVFSSHNRECNNVAPWTLGYLRGVRRSTARHMILRLLTYPAAVVNHLVNRGYERRCDEYAIINDPGENYKLLTYYISVERQIEQLKKVGFTRVEVVAEQSDHKQPQQWLYYVCACS